jgi:hypothetical protein
MHQQAQNFADEERQGRFRDMGDVPHVIGSTPIPQYPELPADSPFHHDPVPQEPPLNYPIDAMPEHEPSAPALPAEETGGAEAPSDPGSLEHAAPPPSQTEES